MEKKKSKFGIIFILIILILISVSIYRVIDNHNQKLYKVFYNEIKEKALNCYFDQKCKGKVTLSFLKENGYIDNLIDPISKNEFIKELIIEYTNGDIIINE